MNSLNADPQQSTNFSPEELTSSPDSEATTEPSYSPTPTAPTTQVSTAGNSLTGIRYEHRIFVTGMTGSGKSELAKALFLSTPLTTPTGKRSRRLIVDPADSDLTSSACDATFSDPRRVPDVATVRFVPNDPEDTDAYNAVYKWAYDRGLVYTWLDEAGVAAPATGGPKWINTYIVQGRKRQLGHLACHVRPREVRKNILGMSTHIFIFALPNVDDRKYLAETIGIPYGVLEQAMAALPKYAFLHFNVETNTLTSYDPLDIR